MLSMPHTHTPSTETHSCKSWLPQSDFFAFIYLFIYYAFSKSIQGWLNLKDIEFVIEIYMS